MSSWSAADSLLVVLDGRPVHLEERYLRMILWVIKLRPRMDAAGTGELGLSYSGSSVAAAVRDSFGADKLEKWMAS